MQSCSMMKKMMMTMREQKQRRKEKKGTISIETGRTFFLFPILFSFRCGRRTTTTTTTTPRVYIHTMQLFFPRFKPRPFFLRPPPPSCSHTRSGEAKGDKN